MTKSQINLLGNRLRANPSDAELLSQLQKFRATYDAPMLATQRAIREQLRIRSTARLKTVTTIVEKLRREKTRLAEMQDIAGLRIVRPNMTLTEQTRIAERICELLPDTKNVDRRRRPTWGYRALHVIARVDGLPVEIQLRTGLQDLWAQAMERLADEAGRDVRYGATPPLHSDRIEMLREVSREVAEVEALVDDIRALAMTSPDPRKSAVLQKERLLERLRIQRSEKLVSKMVANTRRILKMIMNEP